MIIRFFLLNLDPESGGGQRAARCQIEMPMLRNPNFAFGTVRLSVALAGEGNRCYEFRLLQRRIQWRTDFCGEYRIRGKERTPVRQTSHISGVVCEL